MNCSPHITLYRETRITDDLFEKHVLSALSKSAKEHKDWTVDVCIPSGGGYIQLDNAPCQTAGIVRRWFEGHFFAILSWPAQSPDLNPTENL
ncbi:hypothetical protein TNCV_5133851 [Trichonephila clavipes]|nr:hypothetical protein TNCV_5133851 [Trichonephila clavipes]